MIEPRARERGGVVHVCGEVIERFVAGDLFGARDVWRSEAARESRGWVRPVRPLASGSGNIPALRTSARWCASGRTWGRFAERWMVRWMRDQLRWPPNRRSTGLGHREALGPYLAFDAAAVAPLLVRGGVWKPSGVLAVLYLATIRRMLELFEIDLPAGRFVVAPTGRQWGSSPKQWPTTQLLGLLRGDPIADPERMHSAWWERTIANAMAARVTKPDLPGELSVLDLVQRTAEKVHPSMVTFARRLVLWRGRNGSRLAAWVGSPMSRDSASVLAVRVYEPSSSKRSRGPEVVPIVHPGGVGGIVGVRLLDGGDGVQPVMVGGRLGAPLYAPEGAERTVWDPIPAARKLETDHP